MRAVVWDLDGVIVDSAEAHNASCVAMSEEFGVAYDPERDFKSIFGRRNAEIISSLWGITDREQIERMAESKERHFRQAAVSLQPLPGVMELVSALDERGWRQAIGSSAPLENIRILLIATRLTEHMQAVVSGDEVMKGKPDPQVFLLGFERLGVSPGDGVVIEDAPAGIKAGNAAGAATLGVTTTQTEEVLRDAGASRIVGTLKGVTVDDLEGLVRRNSER